MRKEFVLMRWSLNVTRRRVTRNNLVGQFQVQKLAYRLLKAGKLVSAVKESIWYIYMVYVYNSIPDPNMAVVYLHQMFIMLKSSANK